MRNSRSLSLALRAAVGLLLVVPVSGAAIGEGANPEAPAVPEAPKTLPQEGFFSSLKQAVNKGSDHEVVRGHFDLGDPPNTHRYYCLVDSKTGKREPNAVLGTAVPGPGGMTAVRDSSVSMYSCATAERAGMLVSTGYPTGGAPAPPRVLPGEGQSQQSMPPISTPAPRNASPPASLYSGEHFDVAGVRLGMSPDEVRAVLRSKNLPAYCEAMEMLGHLPNARFMNMISTSGGDTLTGEGETFDVMFTPVPGKERAMAIVHSVGYSPAHAVRETALESGLIKKYGGFAPGASLPASPTWRIQNGGAVLVGDPCNGRGTFGGVIGLNGGIGPRQNVALQTTAEEFKSQIEGCGIAIITEDHSTANGNAPRADRIIKRVTVTAYSPSLGLEGATAAGQLGRTAGDSKGKTGESGAREAPAPNL